MWRRSPPSHPGEFSTMKTRPPPLFVSAINTSAAPPLLSQSESPSDSSLDDGKRLMVGSSELSIANCPEMAWWDMECLIHRCNRERPERLQQTAAGRGGTEWYGTDGCRIMTPCATALKCDISRAGRASVSNRASCSHAKSLTTKMRELHMLSAECHHVDTKCKNSNYDGFC